jgi:hypothetical protein
MRKKTATRRSILFLLFMGSLAMLLAVGCAASGNRSTANTKMSESEKAISVARETNPSKNASVELRNAEDKLAQANLAFKNDEFLKATRLAEKATVDADCARSEAKAEKAKADAEQMRQRINSLREGSGRISR